MKLAEALLLRGEYQQRIDALQQRVIDNLKVQENDKPHEDPSGLLAEQMRLADEMGALIKKINAANVATKLEDGRTLAEALIDRDMLMKKRQLLASVANCAVQKDFRLTHAEVKMCVTIDIGALQKQVDDLSASYRALDTMLQGKNWTVDLE